MNLKEARATLKKAKHLEDDIKHLKDLKYNLDDNYFAGFAVRGYVDCYEGGELKPAPIANIPEAEPIMEQLYKVLIVAVPKRIEELKQELAALEGE